MWFSRGIPRARPFFSLGYSQNLILKTTLIKQIWDMVFRKSNSIYFLAQVRIYLFCIVYLII
jgi:hypothetical protein